MNLSEIAGVGLGGGLGSLLRWQIGRIFNEKYNGSFPASTFIINISGAFAIGFISVYIAANWQDSYADTLNAAIITGFLGGYTTFSTMQLDAWQLVNKSERNLALFYLFLSVITGLLSAWAGLSIANSFV